MSELDELLERLYWERDCIQDQIEKTEEMINNIEDGNSMQEEEKETLS